MRVDLFDFELPRRTSLPSGPSRRATPRGCSTSRPTVCMTVSVRDLPSLLRKGDLLVFNDTRVIPARLLGTGTGGGKVEALLIRELGARSLARLRAAGQAAEGRRCARLRGASAPGRGQGRGRFGRCSASTGGRVLAALERGRRGAAAALHPRRHRRCARPRRLPDPVRQARRLGRRADGRPAFHAGADGRPCRGRHRHGRRHAACRRRHLPAGEGRGYRRPRHACRMGRGPAGHGRRRRARPERVVAVGTTSLRLLETVARDGTDEGVDRRDRHLHHAGLPLPRRRPAAHQLPPAALDAVHAGRGLRRAGAHEGRLCARRAASDTASIPTAIVVCCGDESFLRASGQRRRWRAAGGSRRRTARSRRRPSCRSAPRAR